MIVRCGRCQVELEVPGAGEFVCPACGTRNMVRGGAGAAPPSPFGVTDLGAAPPAPNSEGAPGVRWVRCPSCSYRFAVGEVAEVACPTCATSLTVTDQGVEPAP